ncbi:MAG: hypothetical protein WEA99_08670 [Brumimicrobium sp.]
MYEEEPDDRDAYKKLPVYQKAMEITELSVKISEYISDEINDKVTGTELQLAKFHAEEMVSNAFIIPAKIAGAAGADLYDLQMENAAIIRKAARDLQVGCNGFTHCDINGLEYLDILRDEIELFRVEFAEWVKTFDPWNYVIDRWGLFNPPGVEYDDHDPDDDL